MNARQQSYYDRIVEKMKLLRPKAKLKEGACYTNSGTKIPAICEDGHEFGLAPANFLGSRATWCMECSGSAKKTLADYQALAVSKGGKYVASEPAKDNKTRAGGWVCAKEHHFEATYSDVNSGDKWCSICSGCLKKTIEDYQAIAILKGGQYIFDTIPQDSKVPVEGWRCADNHVWKACYHSLSNAQSWCPHCAGCARKTLDDYKALAILRGGTYVLDTIPANVISPTDGWRCRKGHRWPNNYHGISNGNWCPICNESRGERELRRILAILIAEGLLPAGFGKFRIPNQAYTFDFGHATHWLLIEFDGHQHFHPIEFFDGEEGLISNKRRDLHKTQWMLAQGKHRLLRLDYNQLPYIEKYLRWFLSDAANNTVLFVSDALLYEPLLTALSTTEGILSDEYELVTIAPEFR